MGAGSSALCLRTVACRVPVILDIGLIGADLQALTCEYLHRWGHFTKMLAPH